MQLLTCHPFRGAKIEKLQSFLKNAHSLLMPQTALFSLCLSILTGKWIIRNVHELRYTFSFYVSSILCTQTLRVKPLERILTGLDVVASNALDRLD